MVNIEEYDMDALRIELKESLFGAGMVTGMPTPFGEWSDIDNLDDDEVLDKALSMGYDLNEFRKDRYVK